MTFTATHPIPSTPPAHAPASDHLRDLGAPIHGTPKAGVMWTLLMALPTFGLLPALLWPLRFRHMATIERNRLGQLAEWLRLHSGHPNAPRLNKALASVRFRPALYFVSAGCCALIVLLFLSQDALTLAGHNHRLLLFCTYRFYFPGAKWGQWAHAAATGRSAASGLALVQTLFVVWAAGLSAAYLAHWAQVQMYARSIRRFLDEFNKIAVHEALSPVFLQPLGAGIRPMWVLGALVMLAINAPWGIPLMLAGAVQRRYATRAGPNMRSALATRVRDMMLFRRPVSVHPAPFVPPVSAPPRAAPRVRCSTEGCRQSLPAGAQFCPRCGRRTTPPLDRVA